ncbi:MAG: hypothetical protein P8171_07705 [Candidatus Thiodiazotropha sp.]
MCEISFRCLSFLISSYFISSGHTQQTQHYSESEPTSVRKIGRYNIGAYIGIAHIVDVTSTNIGTSISTVPGKPQIEIAVVDIIVATIIQVTAKTLDTERALRGYSR